MFGLNALSVDIIFHPEREKEKCLQGSDEKGNKVKKTLLYYKKKYLKMLYFGTTCPCV